MIGAPFVGPAGKLLDSIIKEAWERGPWAYAMTNLVGCFPAEGKKSGDHAPPDAAIKACRPRLAEIVAMADPALVVTVGTLSTKWVGKYRTELGIKDDVTLLDLPHPAALLRIPVPMQQAQECKRCVVRLRDALAPLLPW